MVELHPSCGQGRSSGRDMGRFTGGTIRFKRRWRALCGRSRRDAQAGFTLVELLLVIVILSIVGGVVATAIVVSGKSTAQTTAQYAESHDAQLASAYWAADVQNANRVSFTALCGGGPGLANLVNFVSDDGSIASYWYGSSQLAR